MEKKFSQNPEGVSFCIDYNSLNSDTYGFTINKDKAIAFAIQNMDDNFADWGHTRWQADLPKDLVKKMLSDFDLTGSGRLEVMTKVTKEVDNHWGAYGQRDESKEEYPYNVKVEMQKINSNPEMKIFFQDKMDLYF